MSAGDEARAEAERRYPLGLSGQRERMYDFQCVFLAGAQWQASRPITDEMVERMARTLFAQTAEARSGWTWPINGDWQRQRDMKDARRILERVLGLPAPVTPTENGENR